MPNELPTEPGAPVTAGTIPLCVPEVRGNEWAYLKECLDTNFVSSVGPFVERFERQVAARVGAIYGVATVNGTEALHIALLVAGVQPEDEVLVPSLTFIAPANAVRYVGAWPVFIDAEADYWQMDCQKVAEFLTAGCQWSGGELRNKGTGRRVKAIIPVHILGHPVDMDPLLELARQYHLIVIEDATESLGTQYSGRPVGHLADLACFSFNGNKIITTGGGGMIVTDHEPWARRARYLTTQAKDDPLEFVHKEIGYNSRLTNLQAAVGCAQLEQLDEHISAKRRIASNYAAGFSALSGVTLMPQASWANSIFWMYTLLIDETVYATDSRALLRELAARQIQTRPLWQPLHRSPAHRGAFATDCPVADRLNRRALSIPCSVGLTPADQQRVIASIKAILVR